MLILFIHRLPVKRRCVIIGCAGTVLRWNQNRTALYVESRNIYELRSGAIGSISPLASIGVQTPAQLSTLLGYNLNIRTKHVVPHLSGTRTLIVSGRRKILSAIYLFVTYL